MIRTAVRATPSFIIPFLDRRNQNDYIELSPLKEKNSETGRDRIKRMFSKNECDEFSVEIHTVMQASMCGAFVGACLGGVIQSRIAFINFIENNQATIFKTPMDAKKKLQDYVTVAFAKGAYRWGWRLSIFTFSFSFISTVIQVYRGDPSIVEYITAGAITGAMYKAELGLAGTIVGAGLGASLSAVGGLVILGLLKVTGISMDDVRKALYKVKEAREDQMNQAYEKAATIKNDDLTRHHDEIVRQKGQITVEEI